MNKALSGIAALALSGPLAAQDMNHAGHDMSTMSMPMPEPVPPSDPHAGHDMSSMAAPDAGGTVASAAPISAPAPPGNWAADSIYDPAVMAKARDSLWREHGGGHFSQIMFNLAEYQVRNRRDGYRWVAQGWFGGDIHRIVVKSEGEGRFGETIENAEVQALYSRAIGPYFNAQAGVRYDFAPDPSRAYATVGFEGLAPYWFDVEGALFLSTKGDLLGRLEGYYDQRITQRLILQPRVEVNLSAQDVPENRTGAGVSNAELGLRLRYEITREFAPYVGISYDHKMGQTARYARTDGEAAYATSLVLGIRSWF